VEEKDRDKSSLSLVSHALREQEVKKQAKAHTLMIVLSQLMGLQQLGGDGGHRTVKLTEQHLS